MARKKLRPVKKPQRRNPSGRKAVKTKGSAANLPAIPVKEEILFGKQHIAAKLIPLSIPSARDAQRAAEKAIENVISAIRHIFTEGDVWIDGLGGFRAAKGVKGGENIIAFTPDEKLTRAVEARLNAPAA